MHPAYSVIFFTVSSGIGYGMLFALGLAGAFDWLPAQRWLGAATFGAAFALVTAGLLSSTFHLGHPERAWRAFSQWRTSWLSREGVLSVATYLPTGLFALAWVVGETHNGAWAWMGLAGSVLSMLTVVSTGMIYASLRTIPRWNQPLVVPVYVLFSVAGGGLCLAFLASVFTTVSPSQTVAAALAVALAWCVKLLYWHRIDNGPARHTASSATGLGTPGNVHLFESPHTSENYLQREMGYRVARKHAARLRLIALCLGGVLPALLCLSAPLGGPMGGSVALGLATMALVLGQLVERWLFFAEARHVVSLYYGEQAA